jgi:hypothetical protein
MGKLSPAQEEIEVHRKALFLAKTLDEAKQAGLDMWKAMRHERGESCGRPCVVCAERMKAAILSCNSCGDPLGQGDMMVCAVCEKALAVKVEPVAGKENTFEVTYGSQPHSPHEYVETSPYKGCGSCGFGPGAYLHNTANIAAQAMKYMQKATLEKKRRIQAMGRVDELKAALGDARQGFELELPGQWPERFNVLLELEPQDPKDWAPRYDYKARPTASLNWPKGDPRRMPTAAELVRVEPLPLDPFAELSAVLWFLASLTSDHEPGCIVKDGKGEPCDCDVTLREGEPWWRRVRASLSLPAALKGRLEKAEGDLEKAVGFARESMRRLENEQKAKCCIDHAGFTPAQPPCGTCVWCLLRARAEKAEVLLKSRRVVAVTPVAGVPGPNGDGTVYEFKMPEGNVKRLIVVRYESGTLRHDQMIATVEQLRKTLPGVLVLFAQPNWELTVLELPT